MSKKQPKELRIESLLAAAVEEFLEKGYDGASVDAIAKRAGVSKGGFYHHFQNKEILFMMANQRLMEPVTEMMGMACSNPSPVEGIGIYITDYLKFWQNRPKELSFFLLSMAKILESQNLREYYKQFIEGYTRFFIGMFQKAVKSGELTIEDPEAYALSLMGALDGIIAYALIHPELEVENMAERFKKVWLYRRKG